MFQNYRQAVKRQKKTVITVFAFFIAGAAPAHEIGYDEAGDITVKCDDGAIGTLRVTGFKFFLEGTLADGRSVMVALSRGSGGSGPSDPAVEVPTAESFALELCEHLNDYSK